MQKNILTDEGLTANILSCIGDGIISTDLSGKITYLNHKAEEIIGIEAKDSMGKDFDKVVLFFHAETRMPIQSPLKKTIENDSITGLENNTVIVTKDSQLKYVSATCSLVKTEDGNTIGLVLVLRDITKIKTIEEINLNDKNNLNAIFINAPVGMITIDENELINQVNDAALYYIDQEREQVLGKHFGISFHCTGSLADERGCGYGPECAECEIRKAILLAIKHGQATSNIEIYKTLIIHRIEKELWFKASVTPIFTKEKIHAVITLLDITDNKIKEINLVRSRDYSNNLLDQTPSLIWKTNRNLECDYVNKVWRDYTGCSLEIAKGYGWADVIHPKDLDDLIKVRNDSAYSMEEYQIEVRLRRFDGVYRWCLIIDTPYFDLNGQYAGYLGSIYDINDEKEAKENLIRYRKVLDNAKDIIVFFDLDGNILEANKRAIETYGYTKEELFSINVRALRHDWNYTEQQLEKANREGIVFEAIHHRKDGSTFPVEVSSQGTNIGGKSILLSIARNITERKKAEKKILENQAKYRSLFMNLQTGYAYYKAVYNDEHKIIDFKYIEVNEAYEKLFNLSKKRLIGKKYSELFPVDTSYFLKTVNQNTYKLARGESIHIDELYSVAHDKWLNFAIYSPKEDDLVTIITDISQMKGTEIKLIAAKETAESANRTKSEFLANMSHEIRTPINGMVGMIDLTLLSKLTLDQRENLITAKGCANLLLNTINDVLDFSKMEAGKLSIDTVNFDIKALIEEVVRTHSPRIRDKGLELKYTFYPGIPQFVKGDPNRIRQVINNLISNAMKFTEEGNITISIEKINDFDNSTELKFSVSDTGIGIAAENLNLLFQSFSQIETSLTKKFGGTGLGLAISKNLVELMGGKINVESQKGKGSTFHFNLTLELGCSLDVNRNKIPNVIKTIKPLKVLLAEDDIINQKVIQKMLREKGHEVQTVNNGLEAVELYEAGKYDVVLMDIQMPLMNGLDATQKIREKEVQGMHTPIIAITAYALQGDRERFLAFGLDEYISKPIQMNELFNTLEKIIKLQENRNNSTIDTVNILLDDSNTSKAMKKLSAVEITQILYLISKSIEKIERAMDSDNLYKIENLAHEIKKMAGDLDAEDIKDDAFRIELAARRGNVEEVFRNIINMKVDFEFYNKTTS